MDREVVIAVTDVRGKDNTTLRLGGRKRRSKSCYYYLSPQGDEDQDFDSHMCLPLRAKTRAPADIAGAIGQDEAA